MELIRREKTRFGAFRLAWTQLDWQTGVQKSREFGGAVCCFVL
jgi:hypothetical protein